MKRRYIYLPLIVGALTPTSIVLILEMVGRRRPRPPLNHLLVLQIYITAFALIPFVALMIATKVISAKLTGSRLECVFWGGLLSIWGFTAYKHLMVWWLPYFGSRKFPIEVVAFLFIPIYALGALAVGLLVGYVISLVAYVFPRGGSPWE